MYMRIPSPVSTIIAVVGYIAGVGTTIVGMVNVGNWSGAEQLVVTAIGGVAALVTHTYTTHKTVVTSPPTAKTTKGVTL